MNKFDKVNIFELEIADRFIFASDKRKVKWQVKTKETFTGIRNRKEVTIFAGITERIIKADKRVIFLRNANDA